jgi:nucleoside-diphosphate-sugar epimerase
MSWMNNQEEMAHFFSIIKPNTDDVDVLNCVGITNSNCKPRDLDNINFKLPVFLSEQSQKLTFRLVTFGTIMEQFPTYASSNHYLASKLKFSREFSLNSDWMNSNMHIQMHTLYGGTRIPAHMFLGQIHRAIRLQEPFYMSAGSQIREYHHVDDVVEAITILNNASCVGVRHISNGNPEKLRDIASSLFNHFSSIHLLNLSASLTDVNDNQEVIFKKTEELATLEFRPTIKGLIEWFAGTGRLNE